MASRGSSTAAGVLRWSWPKAFPLVQFPNPPLIGALLASAAARVTDGEGHRVFTAIFYVALGIWAYEEARHGVNWFRRILGLAFAIYVVVSLSHALQRG